MCIAGCQQEGVKATPLVTEAVELGVTPAFGDADTMSQGPLLRHRSVVHLDARAVDEQPGWHAVDPGKVGKYALPNAALGPAPEAVVERLLRPVDMLGAIAPAATALQCMDNP